MGNLEDSVKKRLVVKWVAAKELVARAREEVVAGSAADEANVEDFRQEERDVIIIDAAVAHFNRLSPEEQAAMKADSSDEKEEEEPEWQRRARLHAAERHGAWAAEHAMEHQNEAVREALRAEGMAEEEVGNTTVKSIRQIEEEPIQRDDVAKIDLEEAGPTKAAMRTHTCYCEIL
jgi:hypothetical protein